MSHFIVRNTLSWLTILPLLLSFRPGGGVRNTAGPAVFRDGLGRGLPSKYGRTRPNRRARPGAKTKMRYRVPGAPGPGRAPGFRNSFCIKAWLPVCVRNRCQRPLRPSKTVEQHCKAQARFDGYVRSCLRKGAAEFNLEPTIEETPRLVSLAEGAPTCNSGNRKLGRGRQLTIPRIVSWAGGQPLTTLRTVSWGRGPPLTVLGIVSVGPRSSLQFLEL